MDFGAPRIRAVLVVAVVATLLVLPPAGRRLIATGGINGDDEARYPLMARDMLVRGVWFDLHVRGARTWEKPPLLPWMIAAFARIRGSVTEATAQLPVGLATIVTVMATFLLADALFTRRAGLWAALILITSYDFFSNSQQVLPDMLVVAFATLAAWCFWQAVSEPSRGRWAWVAFYGAVALAVFAKGPLGLVALLSVAIWLWTEHGAAGTVRHLWQPAGIGLFALITLAWLGPFLALGPRSFAAHTIWGDWLTWYFGLPGSPGDLAYWVVVGCLPWTLVGAVALAYAIRAWNAPAVRFALLWFAVPFAVLLLSAHQKRRYALAIYPGAALVVAWWADAHGTTRTIVGRVVGWVAVGGAAAIAVALRMPQWWHPQMQLYVRGASWRLLLPVFAGLAVIAIAFCWGLCAGRPAFLIYGGVAGMVIILGYGIWPFNQRYNEVWNFKALVSRMDAYAQYGMPAIFLHRPDWLAIDFYAGRSPHSIETIEEFNAYLARPQHPVVVIDEAGWKTYGTQLAPMPRVLEQMAIGEETLMIVRADDKELRSRDGRLGAGSGRTTVLAPDQVEVAGIDKDSRPLTEDKDGIQAVEGVGEQRQATKDREEPERYRDHALLPLLRGNPLDEEPHGEEGLAEKPDRQPDLLVAHRARPRVTFKFGALLRPSLEPSEDLRNEVSRQVTSPG